MEGSWVGELGVATTSELKMHTIPSAFQPARRRIMSSLHDPIIRHFQDDRRLQEMSAANLPKLECPLRVRLQTKRHVRIESVPPPVTDIAGCDHSFRNLPDMATTFAFIKLASIRIWLRAYGVHALAQRRSGARSPKIAGRKHAAITHITTRNRMMASAIWNQNDPPIVRSTISACAAQGEGKHVRRRLDAAAVAVANTSAAVPGHRCSTSPAAPAWRARSTIGRTGRGPMARALRFSSVLDRSHRSHYTSPAAPGDERRRTNLVQFLD